MASETGVKNVKPLGTALIGRLLPREKDPLEIVAACSDAYGVDGCKRLAEIGVTTLQTMPWLFYGGQTESLEKKQEGLRRYADDVIAKLS